MNRVEFISLTRKKKKYRNKSKTYNGRTYHSIKEANYAEELDWRMKVGEIKEIKPQHKIEIKINGKHWRNYYIDFRVVLSDETIQYIEVKGFATEEWKMKWDALDILQKELLEPGSELIVVK